MKKILSILSLSLVLNISCTAYPSYRVKLITEVVDESGTPIKDASVKFHFRDRFAWNGGQRTRYVTKKTNEEGICSARGLQM